MTRVGRAVVVALSSLAASGLLVPSSSAQGPRVPPASGYVFHDEHPVDRFLLRRWISQDSPDDSPSGYCECIAIVYEGERKVLDLGQDFGITAVNVIADVTGDRRAELVVDRNSGGAHCCTSTDIYSVEAVGPRPLLSTTTGNCPAELVDLDKDGIPEVSTCDDAFSYEFCSFAFSPFPPVVFGYDRARGDFRLATPRFAKYLPVPTAADARKTMEENKDIPEVPRCAALAPALALIYTGCAVQAGVA